MNTNQAEIFQSTSSIQRKTIYPPLNSSAKIISIHFLYTEEDTIPPDTCRLVQISIHFLYTEEDAFVVYTIRVQNISIHFLYTEEDDLQRWMRLTG